MKKVLCGTIWSTLLFAAVSFGQTEFDHRTDSFPIDRDQSAGEAVVQENAAGPRFWLSADYLLWWMKNGPINGPLITTGSLNDPMPGALGQPGTRVLFGDGNQNLDAFSGARFQGGVSLDQNYAIEGNYFLLERRSLQYHAGSDANGNPLIVRPIFNNQSGSEGGEGTAFPGEWAGDTDVTSSSRLQAYEFNLARTVRRTDWDRLDLAVGYRSLILNEDLVIQDHLVPLQTGILTFQGGPADPGDTLSDFDVGARNTFYGGQIGGRWQSTFGRFAVDFTGKLALGMTQELAIINGSSTLHTPGGSTTVPGGVLALPSNMGRHYQSVVSVVPESGVNLKWLITPHLNATFGYTFIYWSSVIRPGSEIDRTVNPAQIPTDQHFGNGLGQNAPAFSFHATDFWTQGLNLGLMYEF